MVVREHELDLASIKITNYTAGTPVKFEGATIVTLTVNCKTLEVKVMQGLRELLCVPCFRGKRQRSDLHVITTCTDSTDKKDEKHYKRKRRRMPGDEDYDVFSIDLSDKGGSVGPASVDDTTSGTSNLPAIPGNRPEGNKSIANYGVLIQKREGLRNLLKPSAPMYTTKDNKPTKKGDIDRGWLYAGEYYDWLEWRQDHYEQTGEWLELVPVMTSDRKQEVALDQSGTYFNKFLINNVPLLSGVDLSASTGIRPSTVSTIRDHIHELQPVEADNPVDFKPLPEDTTFIGGEDQSGGAYHHPGDTDNIPL